MKKIFYLFALIGVVLTSCDPLNKTYKDLDSIQPTTFPNYTLTLSATDYALLPTGVAAKTALVFTGTADANTNIPTILNLKFPSAINGSTATITFSVTPNLQIAASNIYANVAYTLTAADYIFPGNTYTDLSASGVLNYLNYKYPTPVANQLAVLTYAYYESGVTASAGTQTTDSFLYINGLWTKIYTVSAAQYTSVGRGLNNWFVAADAANIPGYINTFLKNDPTVAATAKVGDIKYISYRSTVTNQNVISLTYNGTNWVNTSTLGFLKSNGTWIPDPTIYYTLTTADYTYIGTNSTSGSALAKANLLSYKNFNISTSGTTTWSDADLNGALIFFLAYKYTSPTTGQIYKITYYAYSGTYSYPVKTFKYNGTTFEVQ